MPPILDRVGEAVRVPIYQVLFLKIAEPRVIRIMIFFIYAGLLWAGILVIMHKPEQFLKVLGPDLATVFGILLTLGASVGLVAVLPGVWWLERVAIILLATCVSWYVVIIIYLNATPVAGGFAIGFGLFLITRFIEIRGAQLAPREV